MNAVAGLAHHRDNLLDSLWIGRVAQALSYEGVGLSDSPAASPVSAGVRRYRAAFRR